MSTVACRINVNLSERAYAALLERSAEEGLNKTDVINRALQMYADLKREQDRGNMVAVITPDDRGDKIRIWRYA